MSWALIARLFGYMWNYRQLVLIGAAAAAIFGLWQLSAKRADTIEKLRAHITLQQTVIEEHKRAQLELERKAEYEKTNSKIAAESAKAVAAGRVNGDGPMAPVLRTEYDRVQRLAKDRAAAGAR